MPGGKEVEHAFQDVLQDLVRQRGEEEYMLAKPARDAAAKAKMEVEAPSTEEVPLHEEIEWNIRCLMILFLFICMCVREDSKHLSVEIDLIPDLLGCNHLCKGPNSTVISLEYPCAL
ncbi:hypothetical protein JHK82_018355 [Glycine max]|uniref:Ubiquitin-like modifier-activating enzyme 5 n=1 Tax=Glycine soja TaxID=3848 RepID=A0A0B2R6N5_GLYSO|nr:hypothetical protein JHK85_018785 [Glycine max]KAG5037539.1 hypothetical protein JHK86_018379 [Glycine max]KAG5142660.1 hypothetical protein JHK82_018355 [Glycine max]KHN27814.1 Ubiquitin-like modifier-activating enzyme 5 [Glycine soja]